MFYSAFINGANLIAIFRQESGFLRGFHPLGTNGSESRNVVQSVSKRKSKRMSNTRGTSFVLVT